MSFDLREWLIDIGLPQYLELFLSQGFDGPGLASLTDADLRELGIAAMGHRKTILREAASLALPQTLVPEPDQVRAVAPLLPVQPMPRGRVFLSYGHDPACVEIVQRIRFDLQAAGWEPWVDDKGIRFGDDWRREITKGIHESQHVLAFLSQHSTRKPGVCRQEVAIALGPRKGHVYTVLVEPLERVSPPLIVSHMQWLDMQQWQELKVNDPAAYEALYRKSLAEILRVLERNEPFAGDIELLQRWLDPLDGTTDMLAAEEGFTGRRWLLDGLVEQPAWKTDDGSEVFRTEAGSGNPAFAGEADQASPAAPVGEIERWRTSGSPDRVFWISAGPGWGKSAVAARLAHAARGRVMAVHYCRYNKPGTRDARQVVRTLAFQMATQLGDYRELLVRQAQQGTALAELNALELFDKLLANPLAHELGGGRGAHDRHLIVLDALDETLEDDQSELLNLVAGEFGKLPPWLGLVVTSRPEAPVLRQLGAFGVQHQSEDDPRNLQDLRAYVDFWLQGVALEPAQREQALIAVVQASEGIFLYVRQLREAVNSGAVPPAQLTDPGSLPKGLAGLYERWFQHRFPDPARYDEQQRPLLEIMLAAREPLTQDLAAAVLAWGPYGRKVIESLGSMCVRSELGVLSLFHKSLRDWLADPEYSGWAFHASEVEGHRRLAEGIWRALEAWQAAGAPLQVATGWAPLGLHGEAYALRHMPTHLKAAERGTQRQQLLTNFAFAMRRCAGGAVEAMLEDYRSERSAAHGEALTSWAECLMVQGHLLRRGTPDWPAHKILLQVAIDEADNSAVTKAAEAWLAAGGCDWEWLRRKNRPKTQQQNPLLAVMEGHTNWVSGAQILSDGRVLSWSEDATIRIWDPSSGAVLALLKGHNGSVLGAQEMSDSRVLSWSSDCTLRIWDSTTGVQLALLKGHVGWVEEPKILRDGRILSWAVSWSEDRTIRLWNPTSGACMAALEHKGSVTGLQILQDNRLISSSLDNMLRLWDSQSGALLATLEKQTKFAVFPDGRVLSWSGESCEENAQYIWSTKDGALLMSMTGHGDIVRGASILSDSSVLSWSQDGTLRIWDGYSGTAVRVMDGQAGGIWSAEPLPDGRLLSWSSNCLSIWSLRTGARLTTMNGAFDLVKVLPNGHLLSWDDSTSNLSLWDGRTGALLALMKGHTDYDIRLEVSSDSRVLSRCSGRENSDHSLRLWDGNTGVQIAKLTGHLGEVYGARFLSDGRVLSWCWHGLRLWDGYTGTLLNVMEGHTGGVSGVRVLPDERILSWSHDNTLRLWDRQTIALPTNSVGHTHEIRDVRALSNGRILSWSHDTTLRLWDEHSGTQIAVMEGHAGPVYGALEISNGRVISWSYDGTLRVWDGSSARLLGVMEGHTEWVGGAQMLTDHRVLSWSADRTLRIWDVHSGRMLTLMEGHTDWVKHALIISRGRILSWSRDKTLRLWNAETGDLLLVFNGHAREIEGAQEISGGRVLSWSSEENFLRLWDGQTGSLIKLLDGHTRPVKNANVLPDGRVISWAWDHSVCLWNVDYSEPVMVFDGHNGVDGAQFVNGGRLVSWSKDHSYISGTEFGSIRLWDVATGQCLTVVERTWPLGSEIPGIQTEILEDWQPHHRLWFADGFPGCIALARSNGTNLARWMCDGNPRVDTLTPNATVVGHRNSTMIFLQACVGARELNLRDPAPSSLQSARP